MTKRCLGCMKIKENSPVCEHCGYNENVPNYPHQLPVGTILQERYQIGKVLGQGGFGITYMGWDQSLQTAVAVKEYYPNSYVNRDCNQSTDVICGGDTLETLFLHNRERFLREARILAKLSSIPGIVRVQNLFAENNTAYIVMEYVEGIDVKRYLRMQGRTLTVAEVFSLLRPVMESLRKVHQAELVHRDISPDNIMIQHDGKAKLLDFGAAREVIDAEVNKDLPESTEAILKHGFAPIEQYRRRGSLGPWTDVYALCATIYYCLTGKVPNSAPERIMGDDNVNWRSIPDLTEDQILTLEMGMAILPEHRIRTMEDLHEGLFNGRKLRTTLPTTEKPKDYPTNTISLEEKSSVMEIKKKKSRLPVLIAAVLAVGAVAAGIFAIQPKEEDIPTELPQVVPAATETVAGTDPVVVTQEQLQYREAEELEAAGEYSKAAIAFGKLSGYEDARERSFALWGTVTQRKTLAAGQIYTVAIREDGTVVADGCSEELKNELSSWSDIIAVSSGTDHIVGLKDDGTVVTAGKNDHGQCNVADWTDIVAISAAECHTVGLKADGTAVAAGSNDHYETNTHRCDVSRWSDIIAISAGYWNTVGLRSDGTVVVAGYGNWDQKEVADWTDIVAVSAACWHVVGLRSDGTVVAAGDNKFMQCHVSAWSDIVAISAGHRHTLGLKADGTVVAVGSNKDNFSSHAGQCEVSGWKDIAAIDAGEVHSVALKSDGTVVGKGPWHIALDQARSWTGIKLPNAPAPEEAFSEPAPQEGKNRLMSDRGPSAISGNEWEFFRTYSVLGSEIKRNKIMSVTFVKTLRDAPEDAWDVSENLDGSVLAWVEKSADNYNYYDLYIGAEGTITAPENCSYLFAGYVNARSIAFNGVLDTGSAINMSRMFYCCTKLTQLDVGTFDTANVTDMSCMFEACEQLWVLNLRNFDTSKVTDMHGMFGACQNLSQIDVSSFDTSNVTNMHSMFFRLSTLQNLDLQHFDTSKVTDMSWMFSECGKLWNLKVGNWETDNVTNYEFFFFPDRKIEDHRWQDWFEN